MSFEQKDLTTSLLYKCTFQTIFQNWRKFKKRLYLGKNVLSFTKKLHLFRFSPNKYLTL
jgi:hypothetical protein